MLEHGQPDYFEFVPGGGTTVLRIGELSGWQDADRMRYLGFMDEMIAASRLPPLESREAMARIEARLDSLSLIPRYSDVILPALTRAADTVARDEATRQSALTAIAVERYRNVYGHAPDALSDLLPSFLGAVPEDPYDGEPLRYRLTDNGYVIYSVGENQRDDGGVERTQRQRYGEFGDWIFAVSHSP